MHSQRVIHLNQRNRTRNNPDTHPKEQAPSHPADEVKIGIDFWHAVEFSRNRRTPTRNLSATRRGNPSSLDPLSLSVKSRPEPDQMTRGSPSKGSKGRDPDPEAAQRRPGEGCSQRGPGGSSPPQGANATCAEDVPRAPARRDRPPLGVRSSLPGDIQNSRKRSARSQISAGSCQDQGRLQSVTRRSRSGRRRHDHESPSSCPSDSSTAASERRPRRSSSQRPCRAWSGPTVASSSSTLTLFT